MTHKLIHACAGYGKTTNIINYCKEKSPNTNILIITVAMSAQDEIVQRVDKSIPDNNNIEISGWYSFLINHIIKPYIKLQLPRLKIEIAGFINNSQDQVENTRGTKASSPARYMTKDGFLYQHSTEELAKNIIGKRKDLVAKRLKRIYDEIIIDEIQDITRNGIEIIKFLIEQNNVKCTFVGDVRQSTIKTNINANTSIGYDGTNKIKLFLDYQKKNYLTIEEKNTSYRFNQSIAKFSDTIFDDYEHHKFKATKSLMNEKTDHDGIFLIHQNDIDAYIKKFNPKLLRYNKNSWNKYSHLKPINFNQSKGRTYDRVLVLTTDPIKKFILNQDPLKDNSRFGFYVASTRSRFSLAFGLNLNKKEYDKLRTDTKYPFWPNEYRIFIPYMPK